MLELVLLVFSFGVIHCEPETVRDNFDYFNYGANEDVLKNLDLHLVKIFLLHHGYTENFLSSLYLVSRILTFFFSQKTK